MFEIQLTHPGAPERVPTFPTISSPILVIGAPNIKSKTCGKIEAAISAFSERLVPNF